MSSLPPFQRFLDAHRDDVLRYLVASVGTHDADDAFQETFLSALRAYPDLPDDANVEAWLVTIAHRRALDDRRARTRRPPPQSLDADPLGADRGRTAGSAEDEAVDALGTERIREILDRLAPDQRDVIALRVIADLSVEQTAAALGKQPGAVKALQRRALASLRRQLSREGVSP